MRRGGHQRGAARHAALASLALLFPLWGGVPAPAEPPPGEPRVGLEQLLELPSDLEYGIEKRGGMTRGEWRSEFRRLRASLELEEKRLAAARGEMEAIAGSADQWALGPPIPGAASSETPLDYRLRQEISRYKTEIERLERALLDLEVRANLAGVPEDWRG